MYDKNGLVQQTILQAGDVYFKSRSLSKSLSVHLDSLWHNEQVSFFSCSPKTKWIFFFPLLSQSWSFFDTSEEITTSKIKGCDIGKRSQYSLLNSLKSHNTSRFPYDCIARLKCHIYYLILLTCTNSEMNSIFVWSSGLNIWPCGTESVSEWKKHALSCLRDPRHCLPCCLW